MADAVRTWAVVVGIDQYEWGEIPTLKGAVTDAVAAVGWLRELGVQDSHIALRASPTDESRPKLDALDLGYKDARFDSIWEAIEPLGRVLDGDRLFIFLSGHGFFVAGQQRVILTQEYGVSGNFQANLGLDFFIDYFRSFGFREQYLLFDGCQNLPGAWIERSRIEPRKPPAGLWHARPENGLLAFFATQVEDVAIDDPGGGLMMSRMLNGLSFDRLALLEPEDRVQHVVEFDWQTGGRGLNIASFFDDFIVEGVRSDARDRGVNQTPQRVWAPTGHQFRPLLELPPVPTATINLDLTPPHAKEELKEIRLSVRLLGHTRSLVPPIRLPDNCRVPLDSEMDLFCFSKVRNAWRIRSPAPPIVAIRQPRESILIALEEVPDEPTGPWSPVPPNDRFNVKLRNEDGSAGNLHLKFNQDSTLAHVDYGTRYQFLASVEGLEFPIQANASGIRIEPHEDGPDFEVPVTGAVPDRVAPDLVLAWARALGRRFHDLEITLAPPGHQAEDCLPNLEFKLPEGGARSIAGYLAERPVVTVEWVDGPVVPAAKQY